MVPNISLIRIVLTTVIFYPLPFHLQAQERTCLDGKRSYFGVCPDDLNNSRPLQPVAPTLPNPPPPQVPQPISPPKTSSTPWAVVYQHLSKGMHISDWVFAGNEGPEVVRAEGMRRCVKGWRTCQVWIEGPHRCAAVLAVILKNQHWYDNYIPILFDSEEELKAKISSCEANKKGDQCIVEKVWPDSPAIQKYCAK